jgi:hypothetical protein
MRICPPTVLDALAGSSAILDTKANWVALSPLWDRFMGRASHPEWYREALVGKSLLELFPDQKQRNALRKSLASLAEGKLDEHVQTLEFGYGARALHVEMTFRPLRDGAKFAGTLVQLLDVTRDHLNRMALLDRERRMREIQERSETQSTEYAETMARRTLEHSREVSDLHEELERMARNHESEMAKLRGAQATAALKQVEQVSQQSEEFASVVGRMTRGFRENPEGFGQSLCRTFKEVSKCNFAVLYAYSPDNHDYVMRDQWDAPDIFREAIDQGDIRMAEGEGPCGLTAQGQSAVKFNHLTENEAYVPWAHLARDNDYHCLWAIPVKAGDDQFGVIQLYYHEPDVNLTDEEQAVLVAAARSAAPLLFASEDFANYAADISVSAKTRDDIENWHRIMSELAALYGNFLTQVLGHSTLAASEIGETHSAREDLRAIERAARAAAKLTRRLASLSGSSDSSAIVELGKYVQTYLARNRLIPKGGTEPILPAAPCEIRAEVTALETVFEGIVEYAGSITQSGSHPLWTLMQVGESVQLTVLCDVASSMTNGRSASSEPLGFLLAREAAHALAGDIAVESENGHTAMILTLPLAEDEKPVAPPEPVLEEAQPALTSSAVAAPSYVPSNVKSKFVKRKGRRR